MKKKQPKLSLRWLKHLLETCMNKTSDMELSSIMVPPNQTEETNVKNVLQKRCLVHVYVCHFIKDVQTTES
ncbi:hypothetical protein Hanom_Chr17g01535601 [Helianthus anomalus]